MRRSALSAHVCREIVLSEVKQHGPISASEMYARLQAVFPATDFRVFASSLMARNSGLAVIDGVIDYIARDTPKPTARHERQNAKRKTLRYLAERINQRAK